MNVELTYSTFADIHRTLERENIAQRRVDELRGSRVDGGDDRTFGEDDDIAGVLSDKGVGKVVLVERGRGDVVSVQRSNGGAGELENSALANTW